MYSKIHELCESLVTDFNSISAERKQILDELTAFIQNKKENNESIQLLFVCTHNSRRSHLGQIWASVAACYYNITNVITYSAGTEATAFNQNAINALKIQGFSVEQIDTSSNPHFKVSFGINESIECFSKTINDQTNPNSNFAAVMTCSDAYENCPFIPGAEKRIGITYQDPKQFDGTLLQNEKYIERSLQIATECLYVFSNIK
jgi:protein-tyrosine phosphatase/arsenate reductase